MKKKGDRMRPIHLTGGEKEKGKTRYRGRKRRKRIKGWV